MNLFSNGMKILNDAEKVGTLNHHRADVPIEKIEQYLLICSALLLFIRNQNEVLLVRVDVGLDDLSILGMDGLGKKDPPPFGDPLDH